MTRKQSRLPKVVGVAENGERFVAGAQPFENASDGTATASAQPGGHPPAQLAFGPLDAQWGRETSFARQIARILQGRRAVGLAGGRLVQVTTGSAGSVATLSALPGGGYWLLAANFSDQKQHLACQLPADAQGPARDVLTGQSVSMAGRALELDLEARQARHVLLGEPKTHEGAMP